MYGVVSDIAWNRHHLTGPPPYKGYWANPTVDKTKYFVLSFGVRAPSAQCLPDRILGRPDDCLSSENFILRTFRVLVLIYGKPARELFYQHKYIMDEVTKAWM